MVLDQNCWTTSELFRLEDEARYKQTSPENTKYKHLSFNNIHRFCCVPVDFEIVRVDSSASSEDDINNAVTAIKRNGVALKGEHEWTNGSSTTEMFAAY